MGRPAVLVGLLMVLASLLNGSGFFLRRIGVLDGDAYRKDLSVFCSQPLQNWWLPASCHFRKVLSLDPLRVLTIDTGRFYASPGAEILLKLAKYGFLSSLVIVSLLLALRGRNRLPGLRALRPALPLLAILGIGWLTTLREEGLPLASLSLISSLWLALLLVGGWLTRPAELDTIAQAVAVLLVLQLPLGVIEAARGLPTSFGPLVATLYPPETALPSRLAHGFIMPNTLGLMAVCGLGFCFSYGERKWFPWLGLAVLPPVLLARSGAGLVTFLALYGWFGLRWLLSRVPQRTARLLGGLLIAGLTGGLLAGLPHILGRPDLFQSIGGRLAGLSEQLHSQEPTVLLFGQGLGAAGNRLATILRGHHPLQPLLDPWIRDPAPLQNTDSMLALLIAQGGLLAVLAFYGLLLWAFHRDRSARPFLLTILLGSLTLNITEIFPLDLLLALSLNRSLLLPRCPTA
jgi:hypothetical protein